MLYRDIYITPEQQRIKWKRKWLIELTYKGYIVCLCEAVKEGMEQKVATTIIENQVEKIMEMKGKPN